MTLNRSAITERGTKKQGHGANGVVFHVIIKKLQIFLKVNGTVLPDNLTYPTITPVLFEHLFKTEK